MKIVQLSETGNLPWWRKPAALLVLFAIGMPIAFNTWSALLNNFVIEVANFDGSDIGWLHTVREVPGFLAVGVIALIVFVREQVLGIVMLALLGAATAVTAYFPQMAGILTITMLSSIGFHYFETVNQSLQLQWIKKADAPQLIGWLMAVGSAATFVAYVLIVMTWERYNLSYNFVYLVGGGITVAIALFALLTFPQFETPNPQRKQFILRRRYWLYYALQFMAGARRQIFVVFAGFMMVERFGFAVHEITLLYLAVLVTSMIAAPVMGRVVTLFGEQKALLFEYAGLVIVFSAYGGLYFFGWGVTIAAALYIIDHIFFALALALKTYFQKIADPGDIAPTAAVSFTINHIAAVFLPAALGYLWLTSPALVFVAAACMAAVSFCLALLIPRHPVPGHETVFDRLQPTPAE